MTTGKAYGFFDCRYSKSKIESELPDIKDMVGAPSALELDLIEGTENLRGDSELAKLAREAKDSGIKYVLEATYKGATNRETADELSVLMNQMYQSPLYEEGEAFNGAILYQDNGKYVFRE